MKWLSKFEPTTFFSFLFLVFGGVISHLMIFLPIVQKEQRHFHNLSLGLSYDVMNASLLAILLLILGTFLSTRLRKTLHGVVVTLYLVFVFIDFQYVQQFGTHLPISTIEYLEEAESFTSTITTVLKSKSLWFILILPVLFYLPILIFTGRDTKKRNGKVSRFFISLISLILIGGATGSYSNSYVSKNMNDPLTTSGAFYFYWSRHIEAVQIYEKPVEALEYLASKLPGTLPKEKTLQRFPLVRTHSPTTCENTQEQNVIGQSLCGSKKPNFIFLFMESVRAAEMGSYGSDLGLTPNFDKWTKEGLFFKNFYANGFQTRHGQVASYCSLMPNYGAAIMKRYPKNNFICLPEMLKAKGYKTSWLFGSDAAFDDQVNFLPKIGFDQIIDKFSFPSGTETLGWGYSDKALFTKWLDVLDKEKQPFYSSGLTITNHHPFDVPPKYKLNRGDDDTRKYHEAVYYTDAMLGEFLEKAKTKDWYKNSLIFIFSDTANYQQALKPFKDLEDLVTVRSQIPLLIVGGAVRKPAVIEDFYSQIDFAPTVMDLLGDDYTASWAGVSMLSKKLPAIAFTNRPGNYWAVMSRQGRFYRGNDRDDFTYDFVDESLKSEYKKLGLSWIQATQWLLQENLYWHD